MKVSLTPGALKKFRRTSWRFQQTFECPQPSDSENFISTIVVANSELKNGTLRIDRVIFNAEKMMELCPGSNFAHDTSISADSANDSSALLFAAFWDGYDFIFVPAPKPFVFYADHDGWIAFYANTKSNLNQIIEPLAAKGYKMIQNWQQEL